SRPVPWPPIRQTRYNFAPFEMYLPGRCVSLHIPIQQTWRGRLQRRNPQFPPDCPNHYSNARRNAMTRRNTSLPIPIHKYVWLAAVLLAASLSVGQASNAVIKPSDNLVVEGIPPIPLAIAEHANRYTEVREAAFYDWHPTQRDMLISTRFGDTNQVHEVKMP